MPGLFGLSLQTYIAIGFLLLHSLHVSAQETNGPTTFPTRQPGSLGWPSQASPTVPPTQPGSVPITDQHRPGESVPLYPLLANPGQGPSYLPPSTSVSTDPTLISAPQQTLIPGTLASDLANEAAARRAFRWLTWHGETITVFPNQLLWEPPLARKAEPRIQLLGTDLNSRFTDQTIDATVGHTLGLTRIDFAGSDSSMQLDLFAVGLLRFHDLDQFDAIDFRFGVPLSYRRGDWFARIAYEYTTAHVTDQFVQRTGWQRITNSKDEIAIGLGRWMADQVRLYGQAAYAVGFRVSGVDDSSQNRFRLGAGAEWYVRGVTGVTGTPYVAVHTDYRGEAGYNVEVTAQAGWIWRNPYQRLANLRLFAEYYNGRSPFGQFFRDREDTVAVGLSCDY